MSKLEACKSAPSYKLNYYKESKAPLEIFNRIKKEMEQQNDWI